MRTTLLALAVVAVLAAGCGDDDAGTTAGSTTTTTTTDVPKTSTTDGGPATTAATTPDGDLPGEPVEAPPAAGAELVVVGVEAGDVLHVRALPDPGAASVAQLGPLADGVAATGQNRRVGDAVWAQVESDGTTGWVNTAFVAQLGATDDATARLYPEVADRPVAETLVQLAGEVARDAAGDAEPAPRVTVVDGPSVGDLGEVVIDVIGYADDSVLGERLHLFAEEEGSDSFRLRTVEATTLCRRAVSGGLCV